MTTGCRRIAKVQPLSGYRLLVSWRDGGSATVDMSGIIERLSYFASLKDETVFRRIEVIDYGTGVEWANGVDYSADSIEALVSEQATMSADALRAWKREMALSLNEMADIFGVSVSAVKNYLAGQQPVPIAMQIACAAMRRDPNVLYARFRPRVAGRPRKSA